jgi:hypothetical protein
MAAKTLCAISFSLLSLGLFLPAPGAAQRPEPPVPDTTPAPPASYTGGSVSTRIKALERERFDAMVKGDRTLLARILSDDLTYTHATGEVDTKASLLQSLASGKLRYLAITPGEVEVKALGDATAVVTGRADFKVVAEGKELAFPVRFTSVYTRHRGSWLLAAWQSTRLPQ